MTPKEQAEKLIREYYTFGIRKEGQTLSWEEAKECALICVNQIIKALRKGLPDVGVGKGYWYNVRKEIQTS
jgi:hypothetical protein